MQKEPDENIVCEGTDVWADLITAGSGGNNCEDIFLYRTNDGNTWTAWENYIPGTHIETTGIKDIGISYTRETAMQPKLVTQFLWKYYRGQRVKHHKSKH